MNEERFGDIRNTLDNMMKLRTAQGVGTSVRKAQILSHTEGDLLWATGLLGDSNPETLLNTVVFMIGKGFALRAGKEHQALRSLTSNSQFQFLRDSDGYYFIRYTEDIGLKTNKGGIKQRKIQPKEVDLYPIENVQHCPVRFIMAYLMRLPPNRCSTVFYLQPKKKIIDSIWYQDRPCGVNKLRDVVKELCKTAGLTGFYSNHSLRSVAATKNVQGKYRQTINTTDNWA